MLIQSQPIDSKISKIGFDDESEKTPESEIIISQRVGELFDEYDRLKQMYYPTQIPYIRQAAAFAKRALPRSRF